METMTNYAVAGSLRCNFDNQSMLYLPPGSVLKLRELPNIDLKPEYAYMEPTDDVTPKWLLKFDSTSSASEQTDTIDIDISASEALLKNWKLKP